MFAYSRKLRVTLLVGTTMALAPIWASAAQLTYMETESLTVGTRVFQPSAVAFTANGQQVLCSQIAFEIARGNEACFVLLTEADVLTVREMASLGRPFTTASGLTFSPAPGGTGVVAVSDGGQSFPVDGDSSGVGPDSAGGMTVDEIAAFLGLDSAAELGGAQVGLAVDGSVGNGSTLSASVDGSADTDGSLLSVEADADAGDGISAGIDGDAGSDGAGGIDVGLDADGSVGDAGGIDVGVDADASAGGSDGIDASVDADAGAGGSGGIDVDANADASVDDGGVSADIGTSADIGSTSVDVGASADVGSDAGALR